MVGTAVEVGLGPIPGADHNKMGWRFKLTPGVAYCLDDASRSTSEVKVSAEDADRAVYTYTLRFVNGRSVVVFDLAGKTLAQLIPKLDAAQAREPVAAVRREAPRRKRARFEPL